MSKKKFFHERNDFKDLISALGNKLNIENQLVEKDYWIMHAIWGLQKQNYKFDLKGGTSLSKGWNCIQRFSEDIDILIYPPDGHKLPVGKNQDKLSQVKAREEYFNQLASQIKIVGFSEAQRDTAFDQEKFRGAGIRLHYKNHFEEIEGLKDGILLEVGFDQTSPNEERTISSWMMDAAIDVKIDVIDNRALNVRCYVPEYTFVEKLQTISTKYRNYKKEKKKPSNFLRHYYDVYNLLKMDRVQKFIGTDEYKEHKSRRFRKDDEMNLMKNEAFILSDPKERSFFQSEFEKTKSLYFKSQPTLKEIIESLSKWLSKL